MFMGRGIFRGGGARCPGIIKKKIQKLTKKTSLFRPKVRGDINT